MDMNLKKSQNELNIQINLIHTGIDKSTPVYKSVQENNRTFMKESPGHWI